VTWVKLDDNFPSNPKVVDLEDAAFRLYVEGLCYCAANLTDGRLTAGALRRLCGSPSAAELVSAGLWLVTEAGYEVKDYLKYNPSREKVEAERDKAAARKLQWKERATERRSERVANGVRNTHPDPIPSRPEGRGDGGVATQEMPSPEAVKANVPHVQAVRSHLQAVAE
jgi:hypothetical protein